MTSSRKLKLKKPKVHGSTLEETQPDCAVSSTLTATKLPLCCIILKKIRLN